MLIQVLASFVQSLEHNVVATSGDLDDTERSIKRHMRTNFRAPLWSIQPTPNMHAELAARIKS